MRGGLWGQNQKSTPLRQTEIQDRLYVDGDVCVSQDPVFEQNQRKYLNYQNFDVYHRLDTATLQ